MSKRAVLLVVALLWAAAPVQAQEPGEPEPEPEPEPSGDPEPQGNQTSGQSSGTSEPPFIYRLIMEMVQGDGGRCRLTYLSLSDPTASDVDPDNCWIP